MAVNVNTDAEHGVADAAAVADVDECANPDILPPPLTPVVGNRAKLANEFQDVWTVEMKNYRPPPLSHNRDNTTETETAECCLCFGVVLSVMQGSGSCRKKDCPPKTSYDLHTETNLARTVFRKEKASITIP